MNWLRVLKNIPRRFREEVSEQLVHLNREEHSANWYQWFYINKDIRFCCPCDALVIAIWRFHATTIGGRKELMDFLDLAKDCRRLMDVGASAGIFSALFANTRIKSEILAVEPDRHSFELLQETAELNHQHQGTWQFSQTVINDIVGVVKFESSGFGGVISEEGATISSHTLESLSAEKNFIPDLIKMDIESFEYEALRGSQEWLAKHKPKIFLELHLIQLRARGLNPETLTDFLKDLGYRPLHGQSFEKVIRKTTDCAGCARIALVNS